MKKLLTGIALLTASFMLDAQVDLAYQSPDDKIMQWADAPMTPGIRISSEGEYMVLMERDRYKSIVDLSDQEMRLGGLRINPVTNISSRVTYYKGMAIQKVGDKDKTSVSGMPSSPRLANFVWSPDEKYMAFTNTTEKGVELWVVEVKSAKATKLTSDNLNANMGRPMVWMPNSEGFIIKQLPEDKKGLIDKSVAVPTGPVISENDGDKAQNRTYQDLLKDKADEHNFEQLSRATLYNLDLKGNKTEFKPTAMYRGVSFSPDGEYVMVTEIKKPFSYIVPYSRFPYETAVYGKSGAKVKTILDAPLNEVLPIGFMAVRKEMRNISWRSDKAHTLYYCVALDGGDPAKEVEYRDEVFEWTAPFDKDARSIMKCKDRFAGITFSEGDIAIAYDYWWNTRNVRTYLINPNDNGETPVVINERNYQDRYNDPGSYVTKKNDYGRRVLERMGDNLYLLGDGYTKDGIKPFVDEYNIKTKKAKRLYQAQHAGTLETISYAFNMKKGEILTRIESPTEYPNYYIRNIKKRIAPKQITFVENPFNGMKDITKEVITYKRDDGVELSAVMYLPAGYDTKNPTKLPMLMWAYPEEFKDKSSAGQVTNSPYEFIYPYYGSFVYWVNKGYIVLDDASFPIIGEGDKEPNDSFIPQLVANAKAAIDAVDAKGYVDRSRVAVGGHSYGAFMTANLLTHSDLFAAGIARSGAYNRTLTPFGFQSEERSYWEAPEIYYTMAPFMHADKMKYPLLLIHGGADNNSGTYTMQSERYFNALKGLGATVRLVVLPKESHGYAAKESIMHMLWEQDEWLEKYVKNREEEASK
ncbi:MAG: prolyl oligopeptidase family serine peptidase [Schleiferiaceae bacterium]|jgi:dipeptidyl aminopeptidase/acylaminoacyl peptidase|nr:prolyl oligopeptidase family serine peptidase [Schleiferiaceae bacterium]